MNPFIQKINELLVADGRELARTCQRILAGGIPALTSIEIPIKHARRIYTVRASINADRGEPITGFGDLLRNLSNETSSSVGIQNIYVGSETFLLFTTPDVSRIIGILIFPPTPQTAQTTQELLP